MIVVGPRMSGKILHKFLHKFVIDGGFAIDADSRGDVIDTDRVAAELFALPQFGDAFLGHLAQGSIEYDSAILHFR